MTSYLVMKIYLPFYGPGYLGVREPCLRNRTTLRFDFLHSFMVCAQTSAFYFINMIYLRRLGRTPTVVISQVKIGLQKIQ